MPWFPDFTSAVELARRQTQAAGHADPVAQYFAALNQGDTRVLETVWPGEVVVYDPRAGEIRGHKELREFVSTQPVVLRRAARPDRDRGLHRGRRAGRGGTAGPPDPRRAGSGLARRGRRRISRRPVGGVPHLLQPVAGRRATPPQAAHPRARGRGPGRRRRPLPGRAGRGRRRGDRGHLRAGRVLPRADRPAQRPPRRPRAPLVLRCALQRGRRYRAGALRRDRRRRALRPGVQLRPLGQP